MTTVFSPAARCTAPITCMSVGRLLPVGASVSGSTFANQSGFKLGDPARGLVAAETLAKLLQSDQGIRLQRNSAMLHGIVGRNVE